MGDLGEDGLRQSRHGSLEKRKRRELPAGDGLQTRMFREASGRFSWTLLHLDTTRTFRQSGAEAHVFEVSEGDELDDVSGDGLPHGGPQHAVVSVQKLHGLEVGRPHPNDDDGQRQPRGPNDGVLRLVKVCDLAISEDEEDEVLLKRDAGGGFESVHECVHVGSRVCPHSGSVGLGGAGGDGRHMVDDGREVSGSREAELRQNHPVGVDDALNA